MGKSTYITKEEEPGRSIHEVGNTTVYMQLPQPEVINI